MRPFVRRSELTIFLLVLVLLIPRWVSAETTFNRIVVFGTSFSDPGNAYALRGGTSAPPYDTLDPFLVPSDPYSVGGGHHFSNGETWIEQLARSLGLAESTRPAFQPGTGATNYAVGGARAYEDGKNMNLSGQVNRFLSDFGGIAPSDALYVIEMGGNDIRDALATAAAGGDGGALIQKSLIAIEDNIVALHRAGARKFLVWNAPNIGLSPAVRILDRFVPGAAQQAELFAITFNDGLDSVLRSLKRLRKSEIVRFDLFRKVTEIIARSRAAGLNVVDATCVMPNIPPFECQTPDEFFFWDGIHPTRAVHAMVAVQVALTLAGERGDKRSETVLNPFIREHEHSEKN
jgi:phospholipase/lecithinase/hemolysin